MGWFIPILIFFSTFHESVFSASSRIDEGSAQFAESFRAILPAQFVRVTFIRLQFRIHIGRIFRRSLAWTTALKVLIAGFRDRLKVPRDRQTFKRPRFATKRTGSRVPLTRWVVIQEYEFKDTIAGTQGFVHR